MAVYTQIALQIVSLIIAYATRPKPPHQKAASLEDVDLPETDETQEVPVLFGSKIQKGFNVVWYGDFSQNQDTKDGVKRREYSLGFHAGLAYTIDSINFITVDDIQIYSSQITANGTYSITAGDVFGGLSKEGGIVGDLEVMFGADSQTTNAYLTSVQGALQPAYRGVTTVVYHGTISANNVYIKPWEFACTRIYNGWNSEDTKACWYPDKAEIAVLRPDYTFTEDFSAGNLDNYTLEYGSLSWFAVTLGVLVIQNTAGAAPASKITRQLLTFRNYRRITFEFTTSPFSASNNDAPYVSINFAGAETSSLFIVPAREFATDPDQQMWVGVNDGTGTELFTITADTDYRVVIDIDARSTALNIYVYDVATETLQASATDTLASVPQYIESISFYNSSEGPVTHVYTDFDNFVFEAESNNGNDMNPAHIIYQILTDRTWGSMKLPVASIDDTAFRAMADTFYSELLGLSILWTREGPSDQIIQEVAEHCGLVVFQHPSTALFSCRAIRNDYTVGTLPVLDNTNSTMVNFKRSSEDLINQIILEYTDSNDGENYPVTVNNFAAVEAQGAIVSESYQRPAFSNVYTAHKAALRDLRGRSTPVAGAEIVVNRTQWEFVPGDVFVGTYPEHDVSSVVFRVIDADYGTVAENDCKLVVVEDVYGLDNAEYLTPQESLAEDVTATFPSPLTNVAVYETPYWMISAILGQSEANGMAADYGYASTLAEAPASTYSEYDVYSTTSHPTIAYNFGGMGFNQTCFLSSAIDFTETSVVVTVPLLYSGFANAAGKFAIFQTNPADLVNVNLNQEEMVYISAVDTGTNTLTILRGMYDTTPKDYPAGARLWILTESPFRKGNTYLDTDTVNVKFRPYTASEGLPESLIAGLDQFALDTVSRKDRPYPPGKVRINTLENPTTPIDVSASGLTITWEHRDRQKTTAYGQNSTAVTTAESGTTYSAYLYDDDTETLIDSSTGITGKTWSPSGLYAAAARLEIASVRDGYESLQRQIRYFDIILSGTLESVDGDTLESVDGETLNEA